MIPSIPSHKSMRFLLALLLCLPRLHAATPLREAVGAADFSDWKNLNAGRLAWDVEATYTFPDGAKGWYQNGFRAEHDGSGNWWRRLGLRIVLELPGDQAVEFQARIRVPEQPMREDWVQETKATVNLRGAGLHEIVLPWSSFDFLQAQPAFLKFVKTLGFRAKGGEVILKSVEVIRGEVLVVDAEVRGKSAKGGGTVEYPVKISNASYLPQAVRLQMNRHGWESMAANVEPALLDLGPGETKNAVVRVTVNSRIPPGGHEQQVLSAIPNGDGARAVDLEFTTASELAAPYILHTAERWNEVREMVKSQDWAKVEQQKIIDQSTAWKVPEIKMPHERTPDNLGEYLFPTGQELNVMAAGYAWQLTRETSHAEKIALFLRRLSDPATGYETTLRGSNQGFVQEGHFFQHMAMAYDMIGDSGVLTKTDRVQIEKTFRTYIESDMLDLDGGAISNWSVSQHCGALYSALAIQDLSLADRILNGPAGVIDHMTQGIMDDGWWYECSISYNVWVATEFSQVALAMQPWGVNLVEGWVPAGYSKNHGLRPWEAKEGLYGMSFEKRGPVKHNYANLKRFWDALPVLADYRGVIFGINDTTEKPLGGAGYELAYRLFKDPAYAAIIKRGGERDLIYGVPELPKETPDLSGLSAHADNVGVAMLRSKQADPSQRIQAVIHYGTHGSYHGHFDRTNLLSVMRYRKSFFNPEMIWYGYQSFMYKFYCQTSMANNMVVVDGKQQEPVESPLLMFHTGDLFQATAVETNARWADAPFGGMRYPELPSTSLEEKLWMEGRSFPIPKDAPPYGEIGKYGEPVLQRRAMVVTDDYILIADFLKGKEPHVYDSLYQLKGFKGLEAEKTGGRHERQFSTDANSAAQFVTDCDWSPVNAPARAEFNNDGLDIDLISLWPPKPEIMVGSAPESSGGARQLHYSVRGDGKELATGKFGAWVLGSGEIDVPLAGVKTLELETTVNDVEKKAIFWGNPRVVLADGKEVALNSLPMTTQGIAALPSAGHDYYGGPVKMGGQIFESFIAAQALEKNKPGVIRVDLTDLKAARLKASIGADYPLGDESQQRKTVSIRANGKEARFLTIFEPRLGKSVIKKAEAVNADSVRVELNDGRVQEISLAGFGGDGNDIAVTVREMKAGKITREETTK